MPKWIHDRAEHILAKNPAMPKSEAFAIATQQSHALNKSPKSYGTAKGRTTAKAKYKTPGDDQKTASIVLAAFVDELEKIAQEKDSGFLDTVKSLALKDIGGPKGLLQPAQQAAANVGKRVAPAAVNLTRRTSGGAYDVSEMARQMGVT